MLRIDIISVQPTMFSGFLSESIVARAVKKGLCEVNIVDLREFGLGRWKKTDDAPYGGGPGMLMRCEPWFAAVEKCLASSDSCLASYDSCLASSDSCLASRVSCPGGETPGEDMRHETGDTQKGQETRDVNRVRVIMTSPAGKTFTQRDAELFASLATSPSPSTSTPPPPPTPTLPSNSLSHSHSNSLSTSNSNSNSNSFSPSPSTSPSTSPSLHLIFMCGHYEGFDARIETLATDKYSIGDFVMTGGELAAAAMADAIVRLLPGALGGGPAATASESFGSEGMLEAPQYTHPPEFRGMKVPEVLLSGDHRKIEAWKRAEARKLTQAARPDLLRPVDAVSSPRRQKGVIPA